VGIFFQFAESGNRVLLLLQWVLNAVECQLLTTVGTRFNTIKDQLWKTVDEAITLQDCVIYRCAQPLCSCEVEVSK